MFTKKKIIIGIAIMSIIAVCFSGVVLADDTGSYYHDGFKNYFYTLDTVEKDIKQDVYVYDYNYYYERVSDNEPGTYTSRAYYYTAQASDSYMTIHSGNYSSHTLKAPYYASDPGDYDFRLKLNNGTGIKYRIGGDFHIHNS